MLNRSILKSVKSLWEMCDDESRVPRVDTVESFSDASQRPPPGKRIPISRVQHLFDSDTVLNRQKAVNRPVNKLKPINVCEEKKESVSQKRVR